MSTDVEQALSDELLRIHRETHGTGADHAHAHLLDEAVVVFFEDIEFLPNEDFLISEGKGEVVVDMRRKYQSVVSAAFTAAVERAPGRRVVHFTSDTSIDPNVSIEVFRLA
jgi:uncharacterized protein YbcI